MNAHRQVMIGILLSLTTALGWGVLPIAMKDVLLVMEPMTIVWYRFLSAAIGLGLILAYKKRLPRWQVCISRPWRWLIALATLGLAGNFVLYSSSLQYLTPTTMQVLAQLSPMGMLFASVLFLKETLRPSQLVGAILLLLGMFCFFNTGLIEIFTRLTQYTIGVILGVIAAAVWIVYGLAQKLLLQKMASQQILFLIYLLCAIVLSLFAKPQQLLLLNHWQLACLAFCCVNTLISYGALVEAMARWQAAQVSAIVTTTPLFTLLISDMLALIWPSLFHFATLNLLGYIGAIMVVLGAMFSAVGHYWWPRRRQVLSHKVEPQQ